MIWIMKKLFNSLISRSTALNYDSLYTCHCPTRLVRLQVAYGPFKDAYVRMESYCYIRIRVHHMVSIILFSIALTKPVYSGILAI